MKKYRLLIAIFSLLFMPTLGQAIMIDLTTAGSSGTINGAWFYEVNVAPTGTGVIDPFVRIEGAGKDQVQGYNTDGRDKQKAPFDAKSDQYTHSLLLSDVPVVKIDGIDYLEFILDINQNQGGAGELLSLDQLQLYQGSATLLKNFTGETFTNTYLTGLGTPIYNLDVVTGGSVTTDNFIKFDYSLNSGSGKGDMNAYIPVSVLSSGDYLLLYSQFGTNFANNDGFEEWAHRNTNAPVVPIPAAAWLLGSGLLGLVAVRRRFTKKW